MKNLYINSFLSYKWTYNKPFIELLTHFNTNINLEQLTNTRHKFFVNRRLNYIRDNIYLRWNADFKYSERDLFAKLVYNKNFFFNMHYNIFNIRKIKFNFYNLAPLLVTLYSKFY
jgi:hypothetical protein